MPGRAPHPRVLGQHKLNSMEIRERKREPNWDERVGVDLERTGGEELNIIKIHCEIIRINKYILKIILFSLIFKTDKNKIL